MKLTSMILRKPVIVTALFVISFLLHTLLSEHIDPQASMDAAYYRIMAERINAGHGFSEPFIWHHLKQDVSVTHPMDYWQPFGIILYALALKAGPNGDIVLNHLLWSLTAIIVFYMVLKRTQSGMAALLGFWLFACAGKYAFYVSTSDNIAFYALLGLILLNLATNALTLTRVALSGFICGLMTLTRVEGPLFIMLYAAILLIKTCSLKKLILFTTVMILTISPWIYRNLNELGLIWPSNTSALFLLEYSDMFESEIEITSKRYFASGWKNIIGMKLSSLRRNFIDFFLIPNHIIFLPFWILGIAVTWNHEGRLITGFTIFFWVINGMLFTIQSLRGTALHNAAAFLPHGMVIIATGVHYFITHSLNHWRPWAKGSLYVVFMLWAISHSIFGIELSSCSYEEENKPYREFLRKGLIGSENLVLSSSPIIVYLHSKASGIVTPSIGFNQPIATAEKFGCDKILLDMRGKSKKLDEHPGWELVASSNSILLYTRERHYQ